MGTVTQPTPQPSQKWTLNKADLLSWGKWSLAFFAPSIVVFLTEYQTTHNYQSSETMGLNTLIISAIYLFKKFQENS